MLANERRIEFLEQSLQRNERWIALADAKASVILVAIPALLALSGPSIAAFARKRFDTVYEWHAFWPVFGSIMYGVVLAVMGYYAYLAITDSVLVIRPRTTYKNVPAESLIYFDHVSRRTLADFNDEIVNLDSELLIREYIRQVHITSKVCSEKFEGVSRSIGFSAVFLASLLIAYLPTGVV